MPIAPAVTSQSDMINFSIDSILQKPCNAQGCHQFPVNFLSLTNNHELHGDHTTQLSGQTDALNWLKNEFYSTWRNNQIDSRPINPDNTYSPNSLIESPSAKHNSLAKGSSRIHTTHTSNSSKNGRSPRVPFSKYQVQELEAKFQKEKYLSSLDVAELSSRLNLTEIRVKIWFQNRRARERRDQQVKTSQNTEESLIKTPHSMTYSVANYSLCPPHHQSPTQFPNPMVSPGDMHLKHSYNTFSDTLNFPFTMAPQSKFLTRTSFGFGDYQIQSSPKSKLLKSAQEISK